MYGLEKVPEEIENYIQAAAAEPAMEESAIFDAVVDIVVGGEYDYYIYDLVPLGHALYYLSMAKVYDEWIDKITKLREEMAEYEEVAAVMRREKETEEDEILKELQYIKQRINASSSILTDKAENGLLLRGHPRRDDHPRHAKGGRTVRQVRRADVGVRRQPGHSRRAARAENPGLPAQPDGDAERIPGEDRRRYSVRRCWRGCRSWNATSPACR